MDSNKVILTLDAGGTNFSFSAIQNFKEICEPVVLPSNSNNLRLCLETIISGFETLNQNINYEISAISFAFPGPADYKKGIIGDLNNLPAFNGGVALKAFLENHFSLPVFINNDGDLFALGEAIKGFLPFVNKLLNKHGISKQFNNLIGVTLGTGFGAGIVNNGQLLLGDNSNAAEVWLLRNRLNPELNAEEGVSIRAIQKGYYNYAEIKSADSLTPKEIYEIGIGQREGNKEAAIKTYSDFGIVLGDAIANITTLIDGLIVIGGGLSGAKDLFLPSLLKEINSKFNISETTKVKRVVQDVCYLENDEDFNRFLTNEEITIGVPGSNQLIKYDPTKKSAIGFSKLGTNRAVALGAYSFAINRLKDK